MKRKGGHLDPGVYTKACKSSNLFYMGLPLRGFRPEMNPYYNRERNQWKIMNKVYPGSFLQYQ